MADNRKLLMAIREALMLVLGAIEDELGIERSIISRKKRNKLLDNIHGDGV